MAGLLGGVGRRGMGVVVVGVVWMGASLGSGEGATSAGTSSFITAVVVGFSFTGFFGGAGRANLSF